MVIIVKTGTSPGVVAQLIERVKTLGFTPHPIYGVEKTVIAVIGEKTQEKIDTIKTLPGVDRVVPILQPYKLAGREVKPEPTIIRVGPVTIGGPEIVVMAGPCAVESKEQYLETARAVGAAGARVIRGSVFKPRTSPHDFQGLQEPGVEILREVKAQIGMPLVTEILDVRQVEMLAEVVDILQIGARNMTNFTLLSEVGRTRLPCLLKRGISATVDELLKAAEYVIVGGNRSVILCERGIRTFEQATRFTLDLSAVPVLKAQSHLPVIVDPSHAAGNAEYVPALAKAAIAAGADGLLVEVHPQPSEALVDGPQSLRFEDFAQLMRELRAFAEAAGRTFPAAAPIPQ
jgi:3-deoxy-7-phosphoheptulonate synthase